MKQIVITCSIILSSVFSLFASNNPTNSTFTLLPNETSFVLDLEAFEGGVNQMTIVDNDGEIIFSDHINSDKRRIKYVLDQFPADVYTIKVTGEDFAEFYRISVSAGSANLIKSQAYSSPSVESDANRIVLSANNESQEHISLRIYSTDGNMVYSYSEKSAGAYQKAFNIAQLAKGDYRVLASNELFTKEIFISR